VRELTIALAATMLELVGIDADPAATLDDGRAYQVYCDMISAQGGDPVAELPLGTVRQVITAERSGVVAAVDAYDVGIAAWRLGAGRARKEDPVSAGAGLRCLVRVGDAVSVGQPLFELYSDTEAQMAFGQSALSSAVRIGDEPITAGPLLLDRVG
jgi:thymidine phosphorylase